MAAESSPRAPSPASAFSYRHHFTLIVVCGGIFLASLLLGINARDQVFLPPFAAQPVPEVCPFKRTFHTPCPGCGMTRSFVSISHGNWQRAWHFNRVGILLYMFLLAQLVYNLDAVRRLRQGREPHNWRWMEYFGFVVVLLMLLNWGWNLANSVL